MKNISERKYCLTFLAISDWASLSLGVLVGMVDTALHSLETAGFSISSWYWREVSSAASRAVLTAASTLTYWW